MTSVDVQTLMWKGIHTLQTRSSDLLGPPAIDELLTSYQRGQRSTWRARIWRPIQERADLWVCPVHVEGGTQAPVLVQGSDALQALTQACEVLRIRGIEPAENGSTTVHKNAAEPWVQGRLDLQDGPHTAQLWLPEPRPDKPNAWQVRFHLNGMSSSHTLCLSGAILTLAVIVSIWDRTPTAARFIATHGTHPT